MEVDIFEFLSRNTLHDKVVERITTAKLSDRLTTVSCICRFWDSNTQSVQRICLVFENPRIEGNLDVGFDIFEASAEKFGDDIRVALSDSASGLETVVYCSMAVVYCPTY
jgi:hypothetical protein